MNLQSIHLQNFRSYAKADFTFSPEVTFIVGENTAGKSNLIEAMSYLSSGKSFRADKELQVIKFGTEVARVTGKVTGEDSVTLETVFAFLPSPGREAYFQKRFLVNEVPKRRVDFAGILPSVLFTPEDLEIIIASPSIRRNFFDSVLEQIDRDYRQALLSYTKAIRQRNALLEDVRETGSRNTEQFSYWDDLLIKNGQVITRKREVFVTFLNTGEKTILPLQVQYEPSRISVERLLQYKDAEVGAGVTLVGPHRDDFHVTIPVQKEEKDVRYFGSRGQQRLVVLQLKLLQILYMEQSLGSRPLLLLDDIFSELDSGHINHILEEIPKQQTIITTTHEEFLGKYGKSGEIISLEK
jgi:DNA replication and repair protein RecF